MSEFKGTKGPWKQNGNNGIHTKEGSCIALTYRENRNPNAKLISKAPEMLEMLEKVSQFILENEDKNYMVRLLSREVPEIQQLIKEATEI